MQRPRPASPLTFAAEGANQTQTVTVTDNAGNTATFASPAVNIDLTAPSQRRHVLSGATVTLTATDNSLRRCFHLYKIDSGAQQTYTAPFTVTGVGSHTVTYWSVDKAGNTETAHTLQVTIVAPALSGLSLSPASVVYGTSVTATVTLTGPAPTGGLTVTLTSSNTNAATVPATVTVNAGQTTATFPVTTKSVTANASATISAKYLTVSKTAKLTVKPPKVPQAINCGGAAASPFTADGSYSGGSTSKTTHTIATAGVTNPAPVPVYQSQRWGTFTYTLSNLSPGATYTLRLHFCENTYSTAGMRVFNVSANGVSLLTNFDIFVAAGGEYKANVQQFPVTADSNGNVAVQFVPNAGLVAAVNGIQIQ